MWTRLSSSTASSNSFGLHLYSVLPKPLSLTLAPDETRCCSARWPSIAAAGERSLHSQDLNMSMQKLDAWLNRVMTCNSGVRGSTVTTIWYATAEAYRRCHNWACQWFREARCMSYKISWDTVLLFWAKFWSLHPTGLPCTKDEFVHDCGHGLDYWFRAIWQDIHLAATLDRVKSRDRPPASWTCKMFCKDARSREEGQEHGHPWSWAFAMSTFSFQSGWFLNRFNMCNFLPAATCSPNKDGLSARRVGSRSGEIRRHCQIDPMWHANPLWGSTHWAISSGWLEAQFAQEGLLKQEVWSSRLQWLGIKAKKIPLSGTKFNVRQTTLHIDNLPESWPIHTENAWTERFCKVDFTFQDIVEHLQAESFTDDISRAMKTQKPFDGLQCSMNTGFKGTSTMQTHGKEIQFLNCRQNLGTKSHNSSWRVSSSMHQAKTNIECHSVTSWTCWRVKGTWAWPLRNSGFSTNGETKPRRWEYKLLGSCMNSAKPLAALTVTRSWIYLSRNAMECYSNMLMICN